MGVQPSLGGFFACLTHSCNGLYVIILTLPLHKQDRKEFLQCFDLPTRISKRKLRNPTDLLACVAKAQGLVWVGYATDANNVRQNF